MRGCLVSSSKLLQLNNKDKVRTIHINAVQGFNEFTAEAYEKARPSYSSSTTAFIRSVLCDNKTPENFHFLELGAGTGKFTRALFDDENKQQLTSFRSIGSYIASEPSQGFLDVLQKTVPKGVTRVMKATGDQIPLPSSSLDGIIVAQAFHWMSNTPTLNEVHRVLKKDGALVMVWNSMDVSVPWISVLEFDILTRLGYNGTDAPRYITMEWEDIFFQHETKSQFSSLTKWTNPEKIASAVSAQFIIDRLNSVSVVANRTDIEKKQIAKEVQQLLKSHPDTRALSDGEYNLQYRTDVAFCRKF